MKRTIGNVPLCKMSISCQFKGVVDKGVGTYEIGGGAEVHEVGIAFVLILEEGCKGSP